MVTMRDLNLSGDLPEDDDKFMDDWTVLAKHYEDVKARLKEFGAEHQVRTRREDLARMGLEPSDVALLQGMSPEGIESEEQVNG
jgi:hypothetical protein